MNFRTNFLTVRSVVEKMILDADNERRRLESRLGLTSTSQYKANQNAEEDEQNKALLIANLARAESDYNAAPAGSIEQKRFEVTRDRLRVEKKQIDLDEIDNNSDPQKIVDGAASENRIQALFDVQTALVAELRQRLTELPA
jgi:hypothetical protein